VAVSEKHNAAEPNILAGGIVYQNWALKSPALQYQQAACQVLIAELVAKAAQVTYFSRII